MVLCMVHLLSSAVANVEVSETCSLSAAKTECHSVLAADEGLRGRNVLFINSLLRPLLKQVSLTSIYPT